MSLHNIKVVMVETSHAGNIGAAARAMLTMGLERLVLVSPQDFPSQKALWRAAGATKVVEQAEVVESLEQAIADCALVVAASARQRRIPWPMLEPDACAEKLVGVAQSAQVAVVFGREDRGLHNEELQLCNYHVAIPAHEAYPVLNVAAAVQVICYEIRKQFLRLNAVSCNEQSAGQTGGEFPCYMQDWDEALADQAEIQRFYAHLEKVLVDIEFHDPQNPRQLMTRLQRLFNRSHLDQMEVNILRGILTTIEKLAGTR